MEIDRKTLKALAADTRLDILKSLGKRRKMPSELSKELHLASSTVVEHLDRLEEAGLIRREETGHKWIYYSLTDKGSSLVSPKIPVNFVLVLSISIVVVCAGMFYYYTFYSYSSNANTFSETARNMPPAPLAQGAAVTTAMDKTSENITNETNVTNSTNVTNITLPRH
jgi:DNA-binding transcriptional ArsR family regulator